MSTTVAAPHHSQPLSQWLGWLETIHPVAIDMGLERVSTVADRLGLRPAKRPLILIGGTNGKGSTVAMLSAIYQQSGYKVGAYTSPHITHFCERIRVNGAMVDEDAVVEALAFIEQGREPETLTYFEYTTLAAMRIFNVMQCDLLLFEVGLGGRLDATNIWDADCSIVTSVALDHEAYLGTDVSVIATEKAAIGRAGKPFIVGETDPPASLAQYAASHSFDLIDVGAMLVSELPEVAIPGVFQRRNAGCAIAAVNSLQATVPVEPDVACAALMTVALRGRFEKIQIDDVCVVLDVAHNPAGAQALADAWIAEFAGQRCDIVFASLADKDVAGVVTALASIVHTWHCLALDAPRASTARELAEIVRESADVLELDTAQVNEYDRVDQAVQAALQAARADKRSVLVAGSFYTIAAVQALLD
ncbi:MAG: folylpolyglutamate synthase/dihydrofolate synthase family protein [Granulosicoccus sp.]